MESRPASVQPPEYDGKLRCMVKCRRLRGRVVWSVVLTTAIIARLIVQLPPKPLCCVLG